MEIIVDEKKVEKNYQELFGLIKKSVSDSDDKYRKELEDIIFKALKENNFTKTDYKELIGIKIKRMKYDMSENCIDYAYLINDKYRVISENSSDYNTTHYNSIMLLESDIVYTIFSRMKDKVKQTILSDGFLRKIKIKKFLNESSD